MKAFFDLRIKPAADKLDELLGAKKIRVDYTPSVWTLNWDNEFECMHESLITDTRTAYYSRNGEYDDYEVPILICTDCGAEIEDDL